MAGRHSASAQDRPPQRARLASAPTPASSELPWIGNRSFQSLTAAFPDQLFDQHVVDVKAILLGRASSSRFSIRKPSTGPSDVVSVNNGSAQSGPRNERNDDTPRSQLARNQAAKLVAETGAQFLHCFGNIPLTGIFCQAQAIDTCQRLCGWRAMEP